MATTAPAPKKRTANAQVSEPNSLVKVINKKTKAEFTVTQEYYERYQAQLELVE